MATAEQLLRPSLSVYCSSVIAAAATDGSPAGHLGLHVHVVGDDDAHHTGMVLAHMLEHAPSAAPNFHKAGGSTLATAAASIPIFYSSSGTYASTASALPSYAELLAAARQQAVDGAEEVSAQIDALEVSRGLKPGPSRFADVEHTCRFGVANASPPFTLVLCLTASSFDAVVEYYSAPDHKEGPSTPSASAASSVMPRGLPLSASLGGRGRAVHVVGLLSGCDLSTMRGVALYSQLVNELLGRPVAANLANAAHCAPWDWESAVGLTLEQFGRMKGVEATHWMWLP